MIRKVRWAERKNIGMNLEKEKMRMNRGISK